MRQIKPDVLPDTEVHSVPNEVTIFARRPQSMWTGEIDSQGRCQGRGTAYLQNGDVYVGNMQDNLKSGDGTYQWVNG